MKRALRLVAAVGLAQLALVWIPRTPAQAAPQPACPAKLGTFILHQQVGGLAHGAPAWTPTHGAGVSCRYARPQELDFAPVQSQYLLVVEWRPTAIAPEDYYCAGGSAPTPAGGHYRSDVVDSKRRVAGSIQVDDLRGEQPPLGEARRDLQTMMRAAAELAAPCPGATASATAGAPSRGTTATALIGAGAAVSVAAGGGSLLATRRRPRTAHTTPTATDQLYGGADAIEMLLHAGLAAPVRDHTGKIVAYRPLGTLATFLSQSPGHAPAFTTPLRTPGGGQATHLVGVGFQEGPGDTFTSISVIVKENLPPGAAAPDPVVAGPPLPAAGGGSGPPIAPGYDPIAALGGHRAPDATPPPPTPPPPASTPAPVRPPADTGHLHAWLTQPGSKIITPADLHALAPQLIAPNGKLTAGPYAGARPQMHVDSGTITVTLPAPDTPLGMFLPDLTFDATLNIRNGEIAAAVRTDSATTELIQRTTGRSPTELARQHLDTIVRSLQQAGMRIDALHADTGGIRFSVLPRLP